MTGDARQGGEAAEAMTRNRWRAASSYLALGAGVALFTGIIVAHGAGDIAAAVAGVGRGLLLIAAFHVSTLVAHAFAWRQLFPHRPAASAGQFLWARWVGESINDLMPVLQVGGNVVRARLLHHAGVAGSQAAASVVVDITLNMLAQLLFTAVGIALLLVRVGGGGLMHAAAAGAVLMAAAGAAFYAVQQRGLFSIAARLSKRMIGSARQSSVAATAQVFDAAVRRLYRSGSGFAAACAWHFAAWILGAVEIWLALRFLGQESTLATALLLESLAEAVRTAAFAIPGALGVQEGGYLLLGAVLGIRPEIVLALSVVKRVRELLLGVPGLGAWQVRGIASAIASEEP